MFDIVVTMHNVNVYNLEVGSMLEKIKNIIGKFIGFLIIVGIIVALVSVIAIFGGALMKLFGFTYQSVGSIILFFVVSGILGFPIELFVKAIPKVLFSHFKKINELEAKIMFVVLDTLLSMVMFSTVDYFMKSVSATPISLFIVSLVMSLLCMNDVIENKDRYTNLNFRLCNYWLTKCYEKMVAMQPLFLLVLIKKKGGVLL